MVTITEGTQLYWRKYGYRLEVRHPVVSHKSRLFDDFIKFQKMLEDIAEKNGVRVRREYRARQYYATDLKQINTIVNRLQKSPYKRFGIGSFTYMPEGMEYDSLINTQLCNKIPYDRYKYKVHFSSIKFGADEGEKFIRWLDKYDKPREGKQPFLMPFRTRNDFLNHHYSWNGYMYAEDAKHLHLLSFRAYEFINRVTEYKVK